MGDSKTVKATAGVRNTKTGIFEKYDEIFIIVSIERVLNTKLRSKNQIFTNYVGEIRFRNVTYIIPSTDARVFRLESRVL